MRFWRVSLACMLLLAACVLVPAAGRAADQQTASGRALLQAADQLDAAADDASSHHARVSIPSVRLAVSASRSSGVSIDHWLDSQLRRVNGERLATTQVRELRELARSLRRAVREPTGASPQTDPQPLAAGILAQKSYAHELTTPAPPPQETLYDKILKWLGNLVQELLRAVFGAAVAVPALGRILVVAFIVISAAAAAYLIYVLVAIVARRERRKAGALGTPLPVAVQPETLYEQATAAAHAGQYSQAVALLFQASLRAFDTTGRLPYDASLTPGEYRRAVRRTVAAASDPFDQIAKTFVLAAFAQRAITPGDFADADRAYGALRPLLAA